MASVCDICGKGPSFGNTVSTQTVALAVVGIQISNAFALINGYTKRQNVCTSCLKAGKVAR